MNPMNPDPSKFTPKDNADLMSVLGLVSDALQHVMGSAKQDGLFGILSEAGMTRTAFLVHPDLAEANIDHFAQLAMTMGNNNIKAWHLRREEVYQERPSTTLAVMDVSDIVFANWMPIPECPPADPAKDWIFRRYKVDQEDTDKEPMLRLFRDSRIHSTYRDPTLWPELQDE